MAGSLTLSARPSVGAGWLLGGSDDKTTVVSGSKDMADEKHKVNWQMYSWLKMYSSEYNLLQGRTCLGPVCNYFYLIERHKKAIKRNR